MTKRKSIVKKFTKPMKSAGVLSPSQFAVSPKSALHSYEDSPIDEIKRFKEIESNRESVNHEVPDKVELPDMDKIKRIANKLNLLKKLSLENKKNQEKFAVKRGQKPNSSFKKLFLKSSPENSKDSEEAEKKKKILDSEDSTDIPNLPEGSS